MKSKFYFPLFLVFSLFLSCSSDDSTDTAINPLEDDEILYLEVKYSDNTFMGGYVINSTNTDALSTHIDYHEPSDIGYLKVFEDNTDILLFDGGIIWAGEGERTFPDELMPPSSFSSVETEDFVTPSSFQYVGPGDPYDEDLTIPWVAVQSLEVVRDKINDNPNLSVQYFLYTPAVGVLDFSVSYWVFLIK